LPFVGSGDEALRCIPAQVTGREWRLPSEEEHEKPCAIAIFFFEVNGEAPCGRLDREQGLLSVHNPP